MCKPEMGEARAEEEEEWAKKGDDVRRRTSETVNAERLVEVMLLLMRARPILKLIARRARLHRREANGRAGGHEG